MASEEKVISYAAVYEYAFNGLHGGGLENEDFDAIINAIDSVPAVNAVEVPDAMVRKAVELLCKNYEAAKKKPFVQHPLAYALFHTWKEIDRGGA